MNHYKKMNRMLLIMTIRMVKVGIIGKNLQDSNHIRVGRKIRVRNLENQDLDWIARISRHWRRNLIKIKFPRLSHLTICITLNRKKLLMCYYREVNSNKYLINVKVRSELPCKTQRIGDKHWERNPLFI